MDASNPRCGSDSIGVFLFLSCMFVIAINKEEKTEKLQASFTQRQSSVFLSSSFSDQLQCVCKVFVQVFACVLLVDSLGFS